MALGQYGPELKKIKGLLVGSTKGLTVTEIARKMQINRNSVAKYLDVLLTAGIVEMKEVGSAKLFTISKRMSLTSIINVTSDYILVLDEESRVTFANENMLSFEKKTLDEISGISADDLEIVRKAVPGIHPLMKSSLGGQELTSEFEILAGEVSLHFRAKFIPGVLENHKKGLIVILNNLTDMRGFDGVSTQHNDRPESGQDPPGTVEKKYNASSYKDIPGIKNDATFQKYLDLAQDGIWAVDENCRTTFTNAWMAEMLGYTVEGVTGKSICKFINPPDKERAKKYLKSLQNREPVKTEFEFEFIRGDKTRIFTFIRVSPFVNKKGKFIGALATVSDITSRKKAEDALRLSEKYYRTIIETSPNGILIFNMDGNIKMANRQTARYLGFSDAKDLDGKNLFNFVAPNDLEKCQKSFTCVLDGKEIVTTNCFLIKKDCTGFWADLTLSLLGDATENRELFIGILRDITEHRKAVTSIKKSELKYRSLVEGISHIIFTIDLQGKITYVSPVIKNILGYNLNELIDNHFYKIVAADFRHSLGNHFKKAQSGKVRPADFQMIDTQGNPHWIRIVAQPLIHEDRLQGITGLMEDIQDWKQTESALAQCELKYKVVVEDQTDLICRFSPDFCILFTNPAFGKFFNLPDEEILKKSLLDFIPEKYHSTLSATLRQMNRSTAVKTIELAMQSSSGIEYSYHVTIRAVVNAKDIPVEFQLSCRDITEMIDYFVRSQNLLLELQEHQTELNNQNEKLKTLQQNAELSEKRYCDLYDTLPVGSLTLDTVGRVVELNQTASKLLGRGKRHILGQIFSTFLTRDTQDTFARFLTTLFKTRKRHRCEIDLAGNNDISVPFEIKGYITEGSGNESAQCRIVLIDISEKVQADQRIRQLAAFTETNPHPILELGLAGMPVYSNKAVGTLLHALGKEPSEQGLLVPPDISGILNDLKKGVKRQYIRDVTVGGKLFDEILETSPKTGSVHIYIFDNTARRNAELLLERQVALHKAILDNVNIPIFSVDAQYRYTSFNKYHAETMKELYREDIAIGKSHLECIRVKEDREISKTHIDRALKGGYVIAEDGYGDKSLNRRIFEVSYFPIRDLDGQISRAAAVFQDATDLLHPTLTSFEKESPGSGSPAFN